MVRYSNEVVNFDQYEYYIQKQGAILYDRDQYITNRKMTEWDQGVLELMARDVMIQHSKGDFNYLDKSQLLNYLRSVEHCPTHYFKTKGVKSDSIDKNKCLQPLMDNGYAVEFLNYYLESRTLANLANKMATIIDKCANFVGKSKTGASLYAIPYNVNPQANFRYNYRDFDIIGSIPKRFANCISVEEGYLLAWGDFAQSDFRAAYNLFLRSPENDKLMLQYEDQYEALDRMVCAQTGHEFNMEEFKANRKLYKRLTLATMYGTRESKIQAENAFIKTFAKFLNSCPSYTEYYSNIIDLIELGLPLSITSYFGNEQISPYKETTNATLFRALNCPVQSCTSELVILTVCKLLDKFYSMGYTEDDISLYWTRHDEPVFKVKESVMKDSWVFDEFSTILVDDWTPLSLTFEFGYNYLVQDEELTKQYENSIADHERIASSEDSINQIVVNEPPVHKKFTPVLPVCRMQVHYQRINGVGTVLTFYNETENSVYHGLTSVTEDNDVILAIKQQLHDLTLTKQYKGVIVKSLTIPNGEDHNSNGLYIKYVNCVPGITNKSLNLNSYAVCTICKSKGLTPPVNPPRQEYSSFVLGVSQFTDMEQ